MNYFKKIILMILIYKYILHRLYNIDIFLNRIKLAFQKFLEIKKY